MFFHAILVVWIVLFFYPGDGYFIKKDGLNALFAIEGAKICRLNFT